MVLDAFSWSETIGPMRKGETNSGMSHRGNMPALDSVRRDQLGILIRSGCDSHARQEPGELPSLILSFLIPLRKFLAWRAIQAPLRCAVWAATCRRAGRERRYGANARRGS